MSRKFSVVTITRNNKAGLLDTRESLLSQTFKDYEWVIVDGASTDGTAELIAEWRSADVQADSGRDKGIFDAMNKGLFRATGDYIIFMNSGDRFADSKSLAAFASALEAQDVDVIYGGSFMRFPTRRILRRVRKPGYIWHGQPGLHQATAIRRTVHLEYPFDLEYDVVADYDVITRMWRDKRTFATTEALISENDFTQPSNSGSKKAGLLKESVRCQRENLGLSWPVIGASVALRSVNSLGAVILTRLGSR